MYFVTRKASGLVMAHHTGASDNADGTPGGVSVSRAQAMSGDCEVTHIVSPGVRVGCVRCGWPGPDQVLPPSHHHCEVERREKQPDRGDSSLSGGGQCWCDQYTVSSGCSRGQGLVVWRRVQSSAFASPTSLLRCPTLTTLSIKARDQRTING